MENSKGDYIGAFAGIFDSRTGMLLLTREETMLPSGERFLYNWKLPGGRIPGGQFLFGPEQVMQEGIRLVESTAKGLGIHVPDRGEGKGFLVVARMPGCVVMVALVPLPVNAYSLLDDTMRWVAPAEVDDLAEGFISVADAKGRGVLEATGLIGGWGGLMHRAALALFQGSPQVIHRIAPEVVSVLPRLNSIFDPWECEVN